MLSSLKTCARIIASNVIRLRSPYKLMLALTYRCNQRCKVCSIWRKEKTQELTFQEWDSFFSVSNNFAWVALTGGEVFLKNDLVPIISSVVKNCKNLNVLSIATNGYDTGLIVARVKEILATLSQRLFITISLDGPPELHDELRGVAGAWERSIHTFRELKKLSPLTVYLSMTLSAYNMHAIHGTLRAIKEAYPSFDAKKDMNYNLFHTSEHYYSNTNDGKPDIALMQNTIDEAIQLLFEGNKSKSFFQYNYLERCKEYLASNRSPVRCRALSASCFISPDGELFPCHAYNNTLGNIRSYHYDIKSAWRNERAVRIYREISAGSCPGCWSPCEAYQSLLGSLAGSLYTYFTYNGKQSTGTSSGTRV